jgi:hypothetical protein
MENEIEEGIAGDDAEMFANGCRLASGVVTYILELDTVDVEFAVKNLEYGQCLILDDRAVFRVAPACLGYEMNVDALTVSFKIQVWVPGDCDLVMLGVILKSVSMQVEVNEPGIYINRFEFIGLSGLEL